MGMLSDITFVALDFESAGAVRGATDEPVQIAWGAMRGAEIDPSTFFASYLRVDRPITWAAQRVHGITRSHLADAPALNDLWPQLRAAMQGRVLVAHGAGTEKRFLRAFPFHGFARWVDTLALTRAVYPQFGDYSLGPILDRLALVSELDELCPGLCWHHALYDSVACLVFLRHLLRQPHLAAAPVEWFLHPDTSDYYKNQL
jgi:DNA polymerase III subunit epsilon